MSDKLKTNPNKVNQHTAPDPRQTLFLKSYLDPKSKTFSNAYKSAMEVGYSKEYAENMMSLMPAWLSESIESLDLLKIAEKRLKQYVQFEPINEEGKIDHQLMSNQFKAMQLILKGIGKDKYSERQEVTGKDGQELKIVFDNSFKE